MPSWPSRVISLHQTVTYHFAISLKASSKCACSEGPECWAGSEDIFLIPFGLLYCRRAICLSACRAACILRNNYAPHKQVLVLTAIALSIAGISALLLHHNF